MHIALSNTKKLGLVLGAISFTLLSAGCGGDSNSASPENETEILGTGISDMHRRSSATITLHNLIISFATPRKNF